MLGAFLYEVPLTFLILSTESDMLHCGISELSQLYYLIITFLRLMM